MGRSNDPLLGLPSLVPLPPAWDARYLLPARGMQRGDDRFAFFANDIGGGVRVLLVCRHHIERHRLHLAAGVTPGAGEAFQRVQCYLFQLLANAAIAASSHVGSHPCAARLTGRLPYIH